VQARLEDLSARIRQLGYCPPVSRRLTKGGLPVSSDMTGCHPPPWPASAAAPRRPAPAPASAAPFVVRSAGRSTAPAHQDNSLPSEDDRGGRCGSIGVDQPQAAFLVLPTPHQCPFGHRDLALGLHYCQLTRRTGCSVMCRSASRVCGSPERLEGCVDRRVTLGQRCGATGRGATAKMSNLQACGGRGAYAPAIGRLEAPTELGSGGCRARGARL
jgi:hypothetical protein